MGKVLKLLDQFHDNYDFFFCSFRSFKFQIKKNYFSEHCRLKFNHHFKFQGFNPNSFKRIVIKKQTRSCKGDKIKNNVTLNKDNLHFK